jgi:hypothetical protein
VFQISEIPSDYGNNIEQLGTKEKFWFKKDGVKFLFKKNRANTGEDWAEKIACELASLLNIPHADYDFAIWRGDRGVVSPSFCKDGEELVLGNVFLTKFFFKTKSDYDHRQFFRNREHKLRLVLRILANSRLPLDWQIEPGINFSEEVFVGYLLLDALIGNQDRHHENWGFINTFTPDSQLHLAPSFDHASSLGRNESDETRRERMNTKDHQRSVAHYVKRARSAFYSNSGDILTTYKAFEMAKIKYPRAAEIWLNKLNNLKETDWDGILAKVPLELMSNCAKDFTRMMLIANRSNLLLYKDKK